MHDGLVIESDTFRLFYLSLFTTVLRPRMVLKGQFFLFFDNIALLNRIYWSRWLLNAHLFLLFTLSRFIIWHCGLGMLNWCHREGQVGGTLVSLIAVIRVVLNNGSQIVHVKRFKERLHGQLFLFKFDKKLLGVTTGLSARTSTDVLLNSPPLLSMNFKSFKKKEVLFTSPSPHRPSSWSLWFWRVCRLHRQTHTWFFPLAIGSF